VIAAITAALSVGLPNPGNLLPGYPSYYPAGTRVINYPDTAALLTGGQRSVWLMTRNIKSKDKTSSVEPQSW